MRVTDVDPIEAPEEKLVVFSPPQLFNCPNSWPHPLPSEINTF